MPSRSVPNDIEVLREAVDKLTEALDHNASPSDDSHHDVPSEVRQEVQEHFDQEE